MNLKQSAPLMAISALAILILLQPVLGQGLDKSIFPDRGNKEVQQDEQLIASDPAQPFADKGKEFIVTNRFSESKEALRTALRLSPMRLELWALYDEAVMGEFAARMRKEKTTGVIERDINPVFAISRVDSYVELGTLYVVGSLQNLSKETRQKIQISAKMLDENKRELRSETGTLRNTERGLFPNESSLFEIPFKNPPVGGKSFRVEVLAYE